mmetsp:Transcript_28119/g.39550  ORF Transcript_28119/g.39550 Transcript_28119/m.39550 type:complete len:346 (-) Transcript_28119:67-1104(-)
MTRYSSILCAVTVFQSALFLSSAFAPLFTNKRLQLDDGILLFPSGDVNDEKDISNNIPKPMELVSDRRSILTSLMSTSLLGGMILPANAAESSSVLSDLKQAGSSKLETGLLDSRVTENVKSPPPYGMEGSDIFYPPWFGGVWKVNSVTTDVEAPCGLSLFGGNATYQAALREIGPQSALNYESRFISDGSGRVVADREFNVKSIVRVAMGPNSVVNIPLATPNKFCCLLSPAGSPSMVTADLIVLNRRQETIDDHNFDCSEVVRQIISPVGQSPGVPKRSSLLKEIETTSLYTAISPTEIKCRQRSATFLLPSQDDPMAYKAWEYARGRPIDVRFYDVIYTKKQ